MNWKEALIYARRILAEGAVEEAALEGEVLLRHVLGVSRAELYSAPERRLTPEQRQELDRCLGRRLHGEPAAYITGHREFYGLDFLVDRRVLIPRPETELLVEKAIAVARENDIGEIADIGTGSGAIAVSLAVHLPGATIYATDISPEALEVARTNAERHGVAQRITFLCGDLLEALPGPVAMIVANLPYVREDEVRGNAYLAGEPLVSLCGGKDGLDKIRSLCRQAAGRLRKDGFLLLEIGAGQAREVAGILRRAFRGAEPEFYRDLAGIERVVMVRLTAFSQGC
ncbi:MAG: peptide chain release factor N(5)-glutamine methyltransferase [Dehalococcoidales bacterium]|nr:peptide chain release factor N(5)-glutamine methyltransferase [Dehalococcoidales bacterium]